MTTDLSSFLPPPTSSPVLSARDLQTMFSSARRSAATGDNPVANEMRLNRSARTSSLGGSNVTMAPGRPTDPMFYWRQSNIPFDIYKADELRKVREFCRVLYTTHPTIGSVIDVFSTYPLVGMEMVCPKSKEIAEFYQDLFFEQLQYDEFLIDVGKEYWKVGEAFPLGSFNELLGVWETDELQMSEDVKVIRSPFLIEPRMEMRLPIHIRKILIEKRPVYEYTQLIQQYPELAAYATMGNLSINEDDDDPHTWIPVSNMVMSHIKHKADAFHVRGIPITMRAFRPIMQEEMLNAAQDAIATRLYTPLILARLGASAADLGTPQPWIPTSGDLDDFTEDMNLALAADFRLITHHFAVDISNVFGRENMPDLNADFERLEGRILQAYGMSKTMLSGGDQGETFAADAMNRDLLTQLLSTFQKRIRRFVRHRAAVVAEAQGHYDFEIKGGRAVPIMEEIVETDPETGDKRIIRQPKLLVPDLRIRSMNLKDEENMHTLIEQLREAGIPISMRTRLVNVAIDLEEEIEATKQEQVDAAVAAAEVQRSTYMALRKKNLAIPQDLKDLYEPRVITPGDDQAPSDPAVGAQPGDGVIPTLGFNDPASTAALVPTPADINAVDNPTGGPVVAPDPRNRVLMNTEPHRPPESDEARRDMPKAAALDVHLPIEERVARKAHGKFETIGRIINDEEGEVAVPVIGSYHTRHVGQRSDPAVAKAAFWLRAQNEEADRIDADADLAHPV